MLAEGGDTHRCGARSFVLQLQETSVDYSTAPAHLCFWVPLQGRIEVSATRNRAAYEVSGPRLTMIPPGSVWKGSWRGQLSSMMLEVTPALLGEFTHGPIVYPNRGELLVAEDETLRHAILSLQHSLAADTPDNGMFTGHVARAVAWHYLRRYCNSRTPTPAESQKLSAGELNRTLELIEARLGGKVVLEDLADALGMSATSFSRRFKNTVGQPPYQYVLRTRVERAKQQLARQELSVSDLALSLGFYDQSQFSNAFRRIIGLSPREYRRRLQAG